MLLGQKEQSGRLSAEGPLQGASGTVCPSGQEVGCSSFLTSQGPQSLRPMTLSTWTSFKKHLTRLPYVVGVQT